MLKNKYYLLLFFIMVVVVLVYYPALDGPLIADDYPNLIKNSSLKIESLNISSVKNAIFSSSSSQFYRPVSMFSFTLNYYLTEEPYNFSLKLTNLILHILCGVGFYLLSIQLLRYLDKGNETKNKFIAVAVASLWLLHPLFVTTVLYAIQRMAILSTLFIVFGCVAYIKLREKHIEQGSCFYWMIVSIIGFTVLGFFSKENGALLCGFLLLIEYFLFQFKFHDDMPLWQKLFLKSTLIFPVLFIFSYLFYSYVTYPSGELEQYYFSLNDRVLTEFRVMWRYVAWLYLIDGQSMGFHHDDVVISSGLFQPITTIISITTWLIVLICCIRFIKSRHIVIFSVLWFLWGHILESTLLPLVPVYEHRNYLPGFGLIVMFVWLAAQFSNSVNVNQKLGYVILIVIVFLLPVGLLNERVHAWQSEKKLVASLLKQHPESPATLMWASLFLSESNDYENAIIAIKAGAKLLPKEIAFLAVEANIRCLHKPEVIFPKEFSKEINYDYQEVKPTMLLKIQLSSMINTCSNSPVNADILYNFYDKLTESNNKRIKFFAYYGRGVTLIHKKENERAMNDWKKAFQLYPADSEWLKKSIRELEDKEHT